MMIDLFKKFKIWILLIILGGTALGADITIQTKSEITNVIDQKQQEYFLKNGHYMQVLKDRKIPLDKTETWDDVFGTEIKNTDYDIIIDTHELYDEKWYTIRYIEPIILEPFITSTST